MIRRFISLGIVILKKIYQNLCVKCMKYYIFESKKGMIWSHLLDDMARIMKYGE